MNLASWLIAVRRKLLLVAAVVATSFSFGNYQRTCRPAGDRYEAAVAQNDYETVLEILTPLAEKGVASAEFELGNLSFQGHGVPEDLTRAGYWFKRAADHGYAPAQFSLGAMYSGGLGGLPDSVLVALVARATVTSAMQAG